MLSLRDENFQLLESEAQERGITIQELIRAVIIPDWVKLSNGFKAAVVGASRPTSPINGGSREQLVQPVVRRIGTNYQR